MPQLLNRLAACVISVIPLFAISPAHAAEFDWTTEADEDDVEDASRGIPCRRTCQDRLAEDQRDCAKLPEGFLRNGCNARAVFMCRMCEKFCQKGTRECLDVEEDEPIEAECKTQSQSDD